MELDGKRLQLRIVDALAGAVIGVDKTNLAQFHRIAVHRVAVVLAGDVSTDAVQIPDRLVHAPVTVFQLIGAAAGGSTYKLKYGHRGVNQPVRDLNGVRTYITSQNHGYAVDGDTVKLGKVRFVNANDGTCEGIDYPELKAFTVQFHPEACTGPKDTSFLFDQFVELMKGGRV